MLKTLLAALPLLVASLPAPAQQVAFVDLTVPPKTPEPVATTVRVSGGGGIYDHRGPAPGTPAISVRLIRLTTYTERKETGDAVEIEMTNRGDREMSLPIGADPNSSLASGEQDRQYLSLTVRAGTDPHTIVASARAATNRAHPESVIVHIGESVVFRLPFDKTGSAVARAKSAGAHPELTASVSLWRVVVRDGEEWNVQVGDAIKSENALWQ